MSVVHFSIEPRALSGSPLYSGPLSSSTSLVCGRTFLKFKPVGLISITIVPRNGLQENKLLQVTCLVARRVGTSNCISTLLAFLCNAREICFVLRKRGSQDRHRIKRNCVILSLQVNRKHLRQLRLY